MTLLHYITKKKNHQKYEKYKNVVTSSSPYLNIIFIDGSLIVYGVVPDLLL
jgi:hypothetical protein